MFFIVSNQQWFVKNNFQIIKIRFKSLIVDSKFIFETFNCFKMFRNSSNFSKTFCFFFDWSFYCFFVVVSCVSWINHDIVNFDDFFIYFVFYVLNVHVFLFIWIIEILYFFCDIKFFYFFLFCDDFDFFCCKMIINVFLLLNLSIRVKLSIKFWLIVFIKYEMQNLYSIYIKSFS